MSIQNVDTIEPNYDKLKLFILHEAQISQMQIVYNKKHAMREEKLIANKSIIESMNIDDSASTSSTISFPSTTSTSVSSIFTSIDSSHIDFVTKFIKQLAQLSLSLQAAIQKFLPIPSENRGLVTSDSPQSPNARSSSTPNHVTKPFRYI